MRLEMYSIFDKKMMVYSKPFYQVSKPEAIRTFSDLLVDTKSRLALHPSDYDLYYIGSFDDSVGGICAGIHPELVLTGLEVVSGVDKDNVV